MQICDLEMGELLGGFELSYAIRGAFCLGGAAEVSQRSVLCGQTDFYPQYKTGLRLLPAFGTVELTFTVQLLPFAENTQVNVHLT